MELALISRFTWTDGISLVIALLGTILYGVESYVLIIKRNALPKERIVLAAAITFLLYFSGNFLGLFARALAQDFFQTTYTVGWLINLFGLSFMPAFLVHAYAEYFHFSNSRTTGLQLKYLLLHLGSIYFFYQFVHDISSQTPLPWPVLTSGIEPFQFRLFAWWMGICTALAGMICYRLKGNPKWKRFDSYFPINGIFLILAAFIIIPVLSSHPWTPEKAPAVRLLFLVLAFTPGALLAYYLVRYQFLNILVKPTIQYSVLMAVVIIIYQFGIRNLAHYLARFDVINVELVEIILMVLLIFLFHPVRIFLHRKMNQFFFQDTEKFKQTVQSVSQSLKRISSLKQIEKLLTEKLSQTLHLNNVMIIYPDNNNTDLFELAASETDSVLHRDMVREALAENMNNQKLDVLFKIQDQDGFMGCLGLQRQTYKGSFSINDLNLLTTITNHLVLTMRNIKLIEDQVTLEKAMVKQEKLSALGQISASISHEVKNPLHSIYTLVQVMGEEKPSGAELDADIKTIKLEVEHLTNILDEILLYSKPEVYSKRVKTDINKVIKSVIKLLKKEAQRSGIRIDFDPQLNISINSIPGQLKEILFNLVLNAIQACSRQGDQIIIYTLENNDNLKITIQDNGPGIKDLHLIFDPFYTTRKDGTGLGLAIVKNKIEELGGTIQGKNRPDGGAEFIVEF